MNQGTKQRIVGTVVLLALALIFLPIIFDGQGSYQSTISSRIPEPPIVTLMPEPQQVRPVIISDTEAATTTEAEQTGQVLLATEPPPEIVEILETQPDAVAEVSVSEPAFTREIPSLGSDGLPQGWSVRMGSFSDAANAAGLLSQLQEAGYKAYTRSVRNAQDLELIVVLVGPWLDREQVVDYQERLAQDFPLDSIIVRYQPERL